MRRAIVGTALALAAGCLPGATDRPSVVAQHGPDAGPHRASAEAAARVEEVGQRLLAANPFLGVEPAFQVVGLAEPMLTHPDYQGVFLSLGLVEKCDTENALAAVVASEMAQMAAERRTAQKLKAKPGEAESPALDADSLAREALRAAGYPPGELGKVSGLLAEARGNRKLAPAVAPRSAEPTWTR